MTDPHVLRATFDDSAESYDRVRSVASPEVFDALFERARLDPGGRAVEIGTGTGQATRVLAERGLHVVGIELGENLARIARENLAGFPGVSVVASLFEDWDPGDARFDAVVAFNSFHWIDPELRYVKSAALLAPGGALAVVGMRLAEHDGADPVWMTLQDECESLTGVQGPRFHVDAVRDRRGEFEESGLFRNVTLARFTWEITFDADTYAGLLGTQSWYRQLEEPVRGALVDHTHRRITEAPGGRISPTMLAVLYVAERI